MRNDERIVNYWCPECHGYNCKNYRFHKSKHQVEIIEPPRAKEELNK